jgi:hypothetical protein
MNALHESKRVAGVFMEVGAEVIERSLVDRNAGGDRGRVNKYVALLYNLVQLLHVPALVVDVEAPIVIDLNLVAVVALGLDAGALLLEE